MRVDILKQRLSCVGIGVIELEERFAEAGELSQLAGDGGGAAE